MFNTFGVQLGTPGPCHTNNLHGVSYTGHIQDPRHQKVLDQHRSTSSPTQLSKQVLSGSIFHNMVLLLKFHSDYIGKLHKCCGITE